MQHRLAILTLLAAACACEPEGGSPLPGGDADTSEPWELGAALYVRGSDGVDEPGAGGSSQPFRTIQYAVDQATAPVAVLIAAGTYTESVVLKPGVSLFGGFAADDWRDRRVLDRASSRYQTSIRAALNIGIAAGSDITKESVVEGLDIHGGHAVHDHHSYGIYLWDGASPVIRFNTIEGGTGDIYGNGIGLFGSAAVIFANTISGGNAQLTYGIRTGNQSTPLIISNVITGDTALDTSYGILCNNSSPTVIGNTISGGSGAVESFAIFIFAGAAPVVDNNILIAPGREVGHCVYEFAVNCRPVSIRSNDLFQCATSLYRAFGVPGTITDISGVNALAEAAGNVAVDPGFVAQHDWRLQPSSPQAVREGATVMTDAAAAADHDGVLRTAPWSMGAFELDL